MQITLFKKNSGGLYSILFPFLASGVFLLFFLFQSEYNATILHTLVELYVASLAFSILVLAWNSRRLQREPFIDALGTSSGIVAFLGMIHLLTLPEFQILSWETVRSSHTAAVLALHLQGLGLTIALALKGKQVYTNRLYMTGFLLTPVIYWFVFLKLPVFELYGDGIGIILLKDASGVSEASLFILASIILFRKRKHFSTDMISNLYAYIFFSLLALLFFHFSPARTGNMNAFAHIFRSLSMIYLYQTVVTRGLKTPLENLVSQLTEANRLLESRIRPIIRKQAENEDILLHQSNEVAMGHLLGDIVNRWIQPLNTLSMILQDMDETKREGLADDTFLDRSIQQSLNLTHHMSRAMDEFRSFYRPSKERIHFSVHDAIQDTILLLEQAIQNSGVEITLEKDRNSSHDLQTIGYLNEFKHVMINIITNAHDALVEQKNGNPMQVKIGIASCKSEIQVIIEDNGGGIPAPIMNDLFNPYLTMQGDRSSVSSLYLSRVIIEQRMKGKISAENTERGARFSIHVPRVDPQMLISA